MHRLNWGPLVFDGIHIVSCVCVVAVEWNVEFICNVGYTSFHPNTEIKLLCPGQFMDNSIFGYSWCCLIWYKYRSCKEVIGQCKIQALVVQCGVHIGVGSPSSAVIASADIKTLKNAFLSWQEEFFNINFAQFIEFHGT